MVSKQELKMVVAKIGERTYEFNCPLDLADARETYVNCFGGQNTFETELVDAGIEHRVVDQEFIA
jgi:hypothetical protein